MGLLDRGLPVPGGGRVEVGDYSPPSLDVLQRFFRRGLPLVCHTLQPQRSSPKTRGSLSDRQVRDENYICGGGSILWYG